MLLAHPREIGVKISYKRIEMIRLGTAGAAKRWVNRGASVALDRLGWYCTCTWDQSAPVAPNVEARLRSLQPKRVSLEPCFYPFIVLSPDTRLARGRVRRRAIQK